MTGSVVLGVKAVLMNALSLSAVFGILVLIFQHGNLQGLLSYRSTGALDATQPILLFAIGFGLATDYGVILISRIKEAHDSGIPNNAAVAIGLERTGRIVTAAALLFSVAIGAFATSKLIFIKELGLGIALVVLIDASVIRALLVPSLMVLLGNGTGGRLARCGDFASARQPLRLINRNRRAGSSSEPLRRRRRSNHLRGHRQRHFVGVPPAIGARLRASQSGVRRADGGEIREPRNNRQRRLSGVGVCL